MSQEQAGRRVFGTVGWLLTGLFALRILGQAVQRWAPRAELPPFEAFQGSPLPYWLLLSSQLVFLLAMAVISQRMLVGGLRRTRRLSITLGWAGSVYMAAALARICIGLAIPEAPAWFHAWIPATFHLVLAGFVLTTWGYQCQ